MCTLDSFCDRCGGRGYNVYDGRQVRCGRCKGTGKYIPWYRL